MAASAKTRDRIKKLIALSGSPNENEAARAREEADRLMRKHGLSSADFEEDVIEVVDESRSELRQRLAYAVSISRRCTLIVNRLKIAFRGHTKDVTPAANLYRSLTKECVSCCELAHNAPGRDVWRLCYWSGFVDAVVERLMDDEVMEWQAEKVEVAKAQPNKIVKRETEEVIIPAKQELEKATDEFAAHFHPEHRKDGVDWLRKDAYAAGGKLGQSVEIAPREKQVAHVMLDSESEIENETENA